MSASSTDWATDAEPGRQRIPDAERHGHADGRAAAPLLDAGAALRGTAGARRAAEEDQDPGRGPAGLPRQQWPRRHRRAALPASRRQSLLRPQRGVRPALRLPWLEVRRRRQLRRPADLAAGIVLQGHDQAAGLSGARMGRHGLGLHGPARARCRSCRSSSSDWCRRRSRYVSKKWQDCNWVQSLEGAIDTAHFSFLHKVPTQDEKTKLEIFRSTSAIGAGKELQDRIRWVMDDPRPKFAIAGHDTGLVIGAARKTDIGRQVLAHLAVPDAQPRAGAGRLPGRRLSWPVLGAGRRRELLDLHLQLAARPAVHQFRAREICQGPQPARRGRCRLRAGAQHPQRLHARPCEAEDARASPASWA